MKSAYIPKIDFNFWLQIGGTLTFFHEEGQRRCLEVSKHVANEDIMAKVVTDG